MANSKLNSHNAVTLFSAVKTACGRHTALLQEYIHFIDIVSTLGFADEKQVGLKVTAPKGLEELMLYKLN